MTPQQRHDAFRSIADRLWAIRTELEHLYPELLLEVDRRAVKAVGVDLMWAVENCTVVGLHQIGEAMDDAADG